MFNFFNKKKLPDFLDYDLDDVNIIQYADKIDNDKKDYNQTVNNKISKKNKKYFYLLFFIFFVLMLYFLYSLLKSLFSGKINYDIYEVTKGQIVKYTTERGFILRDETVYYSQGTGYINLLCLSNTRTNKGNLLYVINDNDQLQQKKTELSVEDYNKIAINIRKYMNSDLKMNFYNFSNYTKTLQSFINELFNISNISSIIDQGSIKVDFAGIAEQSGIISYALDGYEDLKEEKFNTNLLNSIYNIQVTNQNGTVSKGDKIFKIITSPDYNIIFESKNDYSSVLNKIVKINFQNENIEVDGKITEFTASNHKKYYKLTINKYLEKFLDRRIVEFEIISDAKIGLKIPISAIVEKKCFKIPKNFIYVDEATADDYIIKNNDENNKQLIYINPTKVDNDYYYIPVDNENYIKYTDILIDNQSNILAVNEVVNVLGVYNVNKGYAVLKYVDILDKNSDFAIISKETIKGLEVYDRIVLNAKNVKDGDLISN